MEVSFLWSWWSFFAGIGASVFLTIFLMVLVAIGQMRKAKKKVTAPADELLAELAKWQTKK